MKYIKLYEDTNKNYEEINPEYYSSRDNIFGKNELPKINNIIISMFEIPIYSINNYFKLNTEDNFCISFEAPQEGMFFGRKMKLKFKIDISKDSDDYYLVHINNTCKFKCDQLYGLKSCLLDFKNAEIDPNNCNWYVNNWNDLPF